MLIYTSLELRAPSDWHILPCYSKVMLWREYRFLNNRTNKYTFFYNAHVILNC